MPASWLEFYTICSTFTDFNYNPNDIGLGWKSKFNAITNPSVRQVVLGRDSSVGIATHYGLDGPGIESQWGARFSAPGQTDPRGHPASYTMGTGSFPGVKWLGRGVNHPPPSCAEVKERVEIYLHSPSGPSWPSSRVNFTFYFKLCPISTLRLRTTCQLSWGTFAQLLSFYGLF
jgi:hypothetical protein